MPAFSFKLHRPQFLRSQRSQSRSPNPSSEGPPNDATVSSSLDLDSSQASPSRPASRLCAQEQAANNATPGTPSPAAPANVDGQPSPASPAGTPKSIVPSNTAHILYPHGHATGHSTLPTSSSNHTESFQTPHPLTLPPAPYPTTAFSHYSLSSRHPIEPTNQYLQTPQHRNQGMFHEAHDLTVTGTFIDGNVGSVNINTSNQFMEKLLEKTIPGAEFDSSDRDPPPRCHPGTRLAVLERCLSFIRNCDGQRKIRWVVGAAGVGKSAIMQSVAESPELPVNYQASVFFSINGRDDGTKTITTISYQFAAKSKPYRALIEEEIVQDPSLLRSSLAKQFLKLITEPFILNSQLNSTARVLVIIDGLDECKNFHAQVELLHLISNLCVNYPSSPLVWLVASRPEPHITSFFSSIEIMPGYEKEGIAIDSDEARADVERFLRDEFMKIKQQASDSLDPQWPKEQHIWKLANASGGLFAYARTVIRYIGDSTISSPALQLLDVLNVIDNHPLTGILPEEHPMALLDALYARILSNVPPRFIINTRKLLLALASNWNRDRHIKGNLTVLCNWLGMTPDEAYAVINHLHSVLYVPQRDCAHRENLEAFHKSFIDYIHFTRSGITRNITQESGQLKNECTLRVLKEAPDGINFGDAGCDIDEGSLAPGPGNGDDISLTWPVDRDDHETRICLYKLAIAGVASAMRRGDSTFQSELYVRLLTTRFRSYDADFPHYELRDFVFDESRRRGLTECGILKLIPLREVDISRLMYHIKLQFHHPATVETNLSDPWNLSCDHEREGVWDKGSEQTWTTMFGNTECPSCFDRFKLQLESLRTRSPDCSVPILFTSTGECCVEVRFVDVEDGVSEWTYCFWIEVKEEERKQYGSTV